MKISVLSLWRNSQKHIHRTLAQLESLEKKHSDIDFSYYFYENDSTDNTVRILNEWLEKKDGHLISHKLNAPSFASEGSPYRMAWMASYRNTLLKSVRPLDSEYTLVFDSDIIFEDDLLENFLNYRESSSDWVLLSANTRQNLPCIYDDEVKKDDSYYDVSCLIDSRGIYVATWWDCPLYNSEDREKWYSEESIQVKSAFGSCSLIKTSTLNNPDVQWDSVDGSVEHVGLCFSLQKYGKIYVCPKVKPRVWFKFGTGGDGSEKPWDDEIQDVNNQFARKFVKLSDWEQKESARKTTLNGGVHPFSKADLMGEIQLRKGHEKDLRNENTFSFSEMTEKEDKRAK